MAIVIEDPEVEQRIGKLAAGLNVSAEEIVRAAVQDRCRRLEAQLKVDPETFARRLQAMREVQEWYASFGDKDPRTPDEIIGYNEFGLPE